MIKDNMDKLHVMSEALLTYETIDKDQIDDIMAGKNLARLKDGMTKTMMIKNHLIVRMLRSRDLLIQQVVII